MGMPCRAGEFLLWVWKARFNLGDTVEAFLGLVSSVYQRGLNQAPGHSMDSGKTSKSGFLCQIGNLG